MNCSKIRRLLSAYYDAELPAPRRAAVRRHLQHCPACKTRLDGFKNLAVLAEKFADARPSESLWQALAPKFKAACETAAVAAESGDPRPAPIASLTEQSQKRPSPRRTFKPIVEGLEDRYPLSDLFCASGTALALGPIASAVAFLPRDGELSTSATMRADFTGWGSVAGAMCELGN